MHLRIFSILAASVALASAASVGVTHDKRLLGLGAVGGFSEPDDDPFYQPPSDLNSTKPGQVLKQRPTVSTFVLDYKLINKSYQLMMRSTDSLDEPIGGITTVLVPSKPSKEPKIFSYQNFQDCVSTSCAPSWAFVAGSASPATLAANFEAPIYVSWALSQGYYVVMPDHEGPKASFIAHKNAGQIVADSIRAAITQEKLPTDTKVALYGYSGGAHASVSFEDVYDAYAPEINVVGSAHGGTPIDPEHLLNFLNAGVFSGFAGAGLLGIASQNPPLQAFLDQYVTDKGRDLINRITGKDQCVQNVILQYTFIDYFSLVNYVNPFSEPRVRATLEAETFLRAKTNRTIGVPKFKRLMYHAMYDEIVPYNDSQQYIKDQCDQGADIQSFTLPIAEHLTTQISGWLPTIAWLTQAFDGTLPDVECGTGFNTSSASDAAKVLGSQDLANRYNILKNNPAILQGLAGLAHQDDGNATSVIKDASALNSQAASIVASIVKG